jgi:hypothetical protein
MNSLQKHRQLFIESQMVFLFHFHFLPIIPSNLCSYRSQSTNSPIPPIHFHTITLDVKFDASMVPAGHKTIV